MSTDDSQLATLARSGDQAAFGQLMARHKHALYRYVRRYVAASDDAFDVVQESFVSAWLARDRYDSSRSFSVWLRRIALNKCRDLARKRRAYAALMGAFGFAFGGTQVVHAGERAADRGSNADAVGRLQAAINALPDSLREPLILTSLEGLSHKQAADILSLNPKAVELRVYRARQRLAKVLDPEEFEVIVSLPDG